MTALGTDVPDVAALVYVAAFGLAEGESLGALLGGGPPTAALAHLIVDEQGFGWLPEDDFVAHFASGVDPVRARVLYAVQQPLSMSTLEDVMGVPAWRALPSFYLVGANDQAIPPEAQRMFAQRMGARNRGGRVRPSGDGVPPGRRGCADQDRRGGRRQPLRPVPSSRLRKQGGIAMPMIDVYASEATFADKHELAQDLASAVMRWEQVPDIALFRKNTAAFVHEMASASISNVDGESTYVRVQVLTPIGVLDRAKQLGVVKELTEIVAGAAE